VRRHAQGVRAEAQAKQAGSRVSPARVVIVEGKRAFFKHSAGVGCRKKGGGIEWRGPGSFDGVRPTWGRVRGGFDRVDRLLRPAEEKRGAGSSDGPGGRRRVPAARSRQRVRGSEAFGDPKRSGIRSVRGSEAFGDPSTPRRGCRRQDRRAESAPAPIGPARGGCSEEAGLLLPHRCVAAGDSTTAAGLRKRPGRSCLRGASCAGRVGPLQVLATASARRVARWQFFAP
jgi:hypothetical protein